MDVWQLALYAAASLIALRSLVSLMASHRQQHRERRAEEGPRPQPPKHRHAERAAESAGEFVI